MRIAIIQFPGSNCERETMLAVKRAGMEPCEFLWNEPTEKLTSCQGFIIVGGFSYEDRSRAGIIAALDPIMQVVKAESKLGKPVLGICNGAQILVETGLVPGVENEKLSMVLTDNMRIQGGKILGTGFYNTWVNMRLSDRYQLNAFTRYLKPTDILNIPIAHAEGRFVIPPALLVEMQTQGLNVFQYCDANGAVINEFPVNPNGSVDNIAAVSNKAGNVMAMMPHPERTTNGDAIFQSMRAYIEEGYSQTVSALHYQPRPEAVTAYKKPANHYECVIELIITDNNTMSVQNALQQRDIPVKVKRYLHWEVECDSPEIYEQIKKSGVLYNDRKEKVVSLPSAPKAETERVFLVRPKDDMLGMQKMQMLKDHFEINGIRTIRHGVVWKVTGDKNSITNVMDSHILYNPYAHDCYDY